MKILYINNVIINIRRFNVVISAVFRSGPLNFKGGRWTTHWNSVALLIILNLNRQCTSCNLNSKPIILDSARLSSWRAWLRGEVLRCEAWFYRYVFEFWVHPCFCHRQKRNNQSKWVVTLYDWSGSQLQCIV